MNEVLKASLPGLISAALPTLMVLVGILLNQNRLNSLESSLRADMKALESSLRADMKALESSLRADMKALESSLRGEMATLAATLRGEMATLASTLRGEMAANRKQAHDDLLMLMASDKEQSLKISRLERA